MNEIELKEPTIEYKDDIWTLRSEIFESDDEDKFAGCMSLDECKTPEEYIKICSLRKSADTCEETGAGVPSNTYIAVRISDNRVVGIIDLRHHINHPILGTWGGHTGYSVRPSERRKGYAKEMLRLNIENAKNLGIDKLLVTCKTKNIASEKTIIANGGVFEKTLVVDGEEIKRYWIDIK